MIKAELDRRLPDSFKMPKMTLKKDQIFFEGKASGIRVVNYEKGEIKVGKTSWKYDPDKTPDVNYFALAQFLEQTHKSTAASPFRQTLLPEARASWNLSPLWTGALFGGLIGGFAGLGTAWFTGNSLWLGGLGGAGIGALMGALLGSLQSSPPGAYAPAPATIVH